MFNKSTLSKTPSQTKVLGKDLAKEILETKTKNKAFVLWLKGDLGGGKTTFLQGLAKGLEVKEKITSPTFVIIKRFPLSGYCFKNFFHIDCYRVNNEKEIIDLGLKDIIGNPKNIVAIEWADKIEKLLPKNTLTLNFDFINRTTRKIKRKWKK